MSVPADEMANSVIVNVLAFYSGLLFARAGQSNLVSMAYSLGFGKWLLASLLEHF